MIKHLKRISIFVVSTAMIFFAAQSYADGSLGKAFESRFESNYKNAATGSPGKFKTGTRTTYTGGYIRYRSEVKSAPNVISFQPPGIKGGCNGFDVFGGSFSLISSDELMEWFTAIVDNGMNVLANYLFMTYIQEACAVCSEVMNTLYAMQDFFNNTMQDSCSTATALVGAIAKDGSPESESWQSYKRGVVDSATRLGDTSSNFGDAFSAKKKAEQDIGAVTSSLTAMGHKVFNIKGGNALYHAIINTNLLEIFKDRLDNTGLTAEQLHAYLAGIVGLNSQYLNSDGNPVITKIEPFITFKTFLEPNPQVNEYQGPIKCPNSSECNIPETGKFKDIYDTLTPFSKTFQCIMEGKYNNDESLCPSAAGSNGLLHKLGRDPLAEPGAVEPLTDVEKNFVRSFGRIKLIPLIAKFNADHQLKESAYQCFKEYLEYQTTYDELSYAISTTQRAVASLQVEGKGADAKGMQLERIKASRAALDQEAKTRAEGLRKDSLCDVDILNNFNIFNQLYKDTVEVVSQ